MYKRYGTSSVLNTAILQHDLTRVESILSQGADPNAPDDMGWRPLHAAIGHAYIEGSVKAVKLLVKWGANINEWDSNHTETPILCACDPLNIDIARVLLEAGADPNVRRSDGELPLLLCAEAQNLKLVTLLLQYGAGKTINEIGGVLGWSSLSHAASNFDIPMIDLLLREGADPEAIGEYGETARDALPPREEHDPQEWDRVMEMLGRVNP